MISNRRYFYARKFERLTRELINKNFTNDNHEFPFCSLLESCSIRYGIAYHRYIDISISGRG